MRAAHPRREEGYAQAVQGGLIAPEVHMKRLHVHVAVDDLAASISFYNTLFAAEPTVVKHDYAKWMLDDPRVNFAISKRSAAAGIRHLGIQVEDRRELADVYSRLERAEAPVLEEGATTCCYADSEKSWIADPQGVRWETFLTTGEATSYGGNDQVVAPAESACGGSACCEPRNAA
jgi:catechol 2,3-dioxygenase-like lactoylglutathione lyase family enzyme